MLPEWLEPVPRWLAAIDPRHPVLYAIALTVVGLILLRPIFYRLRRSTPGTTQPVVTHPTGRGEPARVRCPECGAANERRFAFCSACTARLPEAADGKD